MKTAIAVTLTFGLLALGGYFAGQGLPLHAGLLLVLAFAFSAAAKEH